MKVFDTYYCAIPKGRRSELDDLSVRPYMAFDVAVCSRSVAQELKHANAAFDKLWQLEDVCNSWESAKSARWSVSAGKKRAFDVHIVRQCNEVSLNRSAVKAGVISCTCREEYQLWLLSLRNTQKVTSVHVFMTN